MNYYAMQKEIDRLCRIEGLTEVEEMARDWLNQSWAEISETFVIPALTQTINMDSVADQQQYLFPMDYNGADVSIKHNNRRLDPVPEETLKLHFERRTGNLGTVRYYDWSGRAGERNETAFTDCQLTNMSPTVLTSSTSALLNEDHWIVFDPTVQTGDAEPTDPGDYPYRIFAGNQVSGTSFQLTNDYRGPSGTFTARVRPAEQQTFQVYGIPSQAETDVFELRYSSRPRRLYNNADVPEWPNMGLPIVYMALSVAFDFHQMPKMSQIWWKKATRRVGNLQRRRDRNATLNTDMVIGSAVGRHQGIQGIFTQKGYGLRGY